MDLDSQTPSGRCHDSAYVCFGAEPQGTTKGEARRQGLGNEPPSAVLSSQLCCFVQERTRAGGVESLQKTPVTAEWQETVFRVRNSLGPVTSND